jgi:lipopolysaccharide export system permease protein
MNLLHRYIFKSITLASLMAVGLFAFVLLVGNVLRDVVGLVADGQLSLGLLFGLVALLIPYVVAYALPLGILTGVLLVLGRLSAQREITAMRSAGLSLFQIASPIFFLALIGLVFAVLVNFHYAPHARSQYREDLAQAIRVNPLSFIVEQNFVRHFPGYVLYVGEKREQRLRDVWVWELDDQRRVLKFIQAEEANLDYDPVTESLLLSLDHGYSEARSERDPEDVRTARPPLEFERTSIRLPLDQILGGQTTTKKLSRMTFNEVMQERQRLLTLASEEPDEAHDLGLLRIRMLIHERFAMAYAILSLATLAIPLGITIQRKETSANLFVALILALSFYLLMVIIAWFERMPHLRPDLLMWVPNLGFQALGIWLFVRSEKR